MCVFWGTVSLNILLICLRKELQKVVFILEIFCIFPLPQILGVIAAVGSNITSLNFSKKLCSLPKV